MKIITKNNKMFARFSKSDRSIEIIDHPITQEEKFNLLDDNGKCVASSLKLEGIPLIIIEDKIEKLADEYCTQYFPHVNTAGHWIGFQDGYKAATKEYTMEDLINAIRMGREVKGYKWDENEGRITIRYSEEEIIKSLTKSSIPDEIELEVELVQINHASGLQPTGHELMDVSISQNYKLKTNSYNEIHISL